ncbi:helix-turn-helix domain-containing protein [Oryzibacter oryziterrae]|uniref:helix-turn-helix domain-containing protein n=1 Tax=Oryzibacter oryziterrae TaxID=2766474 RepID=UPI001F22D655|nr:helix-turn-helix transcriptional regulator [Oryzibacter oryziterrae]
MVSPLEESRDVALYDAHKREFAEGGDVVLPAEASALLLKSNSRPRAVRLWRGLTQVDLTEKVGIARGYLSEIESGAKGCSAETLTALARVLAVPERWIG